MALKAIKINGSQVAQVDEIAVSKSENLITSGAVKGSKVVDVKYIGTEHINLGFLSNFSDGELFITSGGSNPANVYKLYVCVEDSGLGYEQVPFEHDCIYLLPNGDGYTYDETQVNNKPKHAMGSIVTYEDGQGLTAAQQDNARKNIGFVVLTESEYEALVNSQQIDPNIIYMTTEED